MDCKTILVEAVRSTQDLPLELREHIADVRSVEEHRFDSTYIEFLDTQIHLSPRGPEWTDLLMRRRAAILPYCDMALVRGSVRVGKSDFTVEVDPTTKTVIHWERHDCEKCA